MRIYVEFEGKDPIVVNINYNRAVNHFIYSILDSEEYRDFLTNQAYKADGRIFKFFTFSRLQGDFKVFEKKGQKVMLFSNTVRLIISSPVEAFIISFIKGILKKNTIDFCGNEVFLKRVDLWQQKGFKNRCIIKMLTPVVVYRKDSKTVLNRRFLSPFEEDFEMVIKENIKSKLKALDITTEKFDFSIKPLNVIEEKDKKIIKISNDFVIGWMGKYLIEGTKETIEIAYYSGLGAKNSLGFGMFDIVA